jgi:predicted transcriptional regulator of viral defense system
MTNTLRDVQSEGRTTGALTRRVQAEYAEMPGLSVTIAQAQRLLDIDRATCALVFKALVNRGVLRRTAQGKYVRA